MNDQLFYVFHCNISIGAIFSGSQDECRAYVLSQPQLLVSSIITDEDEYQMLSNMPGEQVRKYFDNLKELAKGYGWPVVLPEEEASHDADELEGNNEGFPDTLY